MTARYMFHFSWKLQLCMRCAQEAMYRCLIDMAAGMDYLHSLGVINGDLKPANVLLKSTNADARGFVCKARTALACMSASCEERTARSATCGGPALLRLCAAMHSWRTLG
jgi:serine/threonine protein kinase